MFTTRQTLCSLFLVTGVFTLFVYNRPAGFGVSEIHATGKQTPAPAVAMQRQPLTYYTRYTGGSMFGASAPVTNVAPVKVQMSSGAGTVYSPARALQSSDNSDPMADYVFTGIVNAEGRTKALIEHARTRAGEYLGVGDRFLNGKILSIDARQVTLTLKGKRYSLARFENYRLTPLDANAQFLKEGAPVPGGTSVSVSEPAPMMPPGFDVPLTPIGQPGAPPVPLPFGNALGGIEPAVKATAQSSPQSLALPPAEATVAPVNANPPPIEIRETEQ